MNYGNIDYANDGQYRCGTFARFTFLEGVIQRDNAEIQEQKQ